MTANKHIVFICSSMNMPGGIERAIANTANLFNSKGQRVTLFILAETKQSFYFLAPSIKTESDNLHFGITDKGNTISRKLQFIQHISALRNKLEAMKPDIIITTEYVFTITARIAIKNIKIYSWEHHHFNHLKKNKFWQILYSKFYPKAEKIICLNSSEAKYYLALGISTSVIPNFILPLSTSNTYADSKTILTIGWLTLIKGSDLIPKIAELIFDKHPDWKWRIIGTGAEKESLIKEIELKGLVENVQIVEPVSPDLESEYGNASIYVLTSKFECFPMVLLEAMSYGVPPVAFDCPTGPAHIINNGEDGMLVEAGNVTALAAAIINLIEDEQKRKAMSIIASRNIQRFSPDEIYRLWKSALAIE